MNFRVLSNFVAPLKTKHTSIHAAVKNGDVEEIIAMVKAGASINEVDQENKFTPLHWAAHSGALEVGCIKRGVLKVKDVLT